MKIEMTKAWCLAMAEQEGTCEIGAGAIARDPSPDSGLEPIPIEQDRRVAFGRFVNLMRRQLRLSVEQLAEKSFLEVAEILSIEEDIRYQPEPRSIYRLAEVFGVPQQKLMQVAGLAVSTDVSFREEAVRFAARSESVQQLTPEERSALESFVAFLGGKRP